MQLKELQQISLQPMRSLLKKGPFSLLCGVYVCCNVIEEGTDIRNYMFAVCNSALTLVFRLLCVVLSLLCVCLCNVFVFLSLCVWWLLVYSLHSLTFSKQKRLPLLHYYEDEYPHFFNPIAVTFRTTFTTPLELTLVTSRSFP